jgi:hypothetical protein
MEHPENRGGFILVLHYPSIGVKAKVLAERRQL